MHSLTDAGDTRSNIVIIATMSTSLQKTDSISTLCISTATFLYTCLEGNGDSGTGGDESEAGKNGKDG